LENFFGGEGFEGGDGGFGDGGDGIVVVGDAGGFVDELEAMGECAEVGEGVGGLLPGNAEAGRGGEGGLGVELVVIAGEAEGKAGVGGGVEPFNLRAGVASEVLGGVAGAVENGEVVFGLVFYDDALGVDVGFKAAVPFDVIARDHGDDGDVGRPIGGAEMLEHVAGKLEDDGVIRANAREGFEEGSSDVAADEDAVAEFLAEDGSEHGGGGGFALGARHPECEIGGASLGEEADFGGDGDAGGAGGGEVLISERNGGGGDDEVGLGEVFFAVFAESIGDGEALELGEGIGELGGGSGIGDKDFSALGDEPARDGDAAAEVAQALDGDALVGERGHGFIVMDWGRFAIMGV